MHQCSQRVELPGIIYFVIAHIPKALCPLGHSALSSCSMLHTQMIMDLIESDGSAKSSDTSSCLQVPVNHLAFREFLFQG